MNSTTVDDIAINLATSYKEVISLVQGILLHYPIRDLLREACATGATHLIGWNFPLCFSILYTSYFLWFNFLLHYPTRDLGYRMARNFRGTKF